MPALAAILIPVCLLGAGLAAVAAWRVRGTTLIHPCIWVCIHFAVSASLPFCTSEGLRFVVTCSTLLPFISLLGSRRPHDRGWHFVVLTLWIVISQPGWQAFFLRTGGAFALTDARLFLTWALLIGSALTYLPTRNWVSAMFAGAGQGLLLAPTLLGVQWNQLLFELSAELLQLVGLALVLVRSRLGRPPIAPISAAWLRYRDGFGAVWGLRLLERLRGQVFARSWDLTLKWQGFEGEAYWSAEQRQLIAQELRNVTRRFESQTSNEERLTEPATSD